MMYLGFPHQQLAGIERLPTCTTGKARDLPQTTFSIGVTTAHDGGMAYVETLVQQYLDNPSHDCPLYYAAKPSTTGLIQS